MAVVTLSKLKGNTMAIQELNNAEIETVAGGLSIGLGPISLDLNALSSALTGSINGLVDGLQSFVGALLAKLPALPVITIPFLGLTIDLTIG